MSTNSLVMISAVSSIIVCMGVVFELVKPWRDRRFEQKWERKKSKDYDTRK